MLANLHGCLTLQGLVSGTKLRYMSGATTADVDLSSQLFVELLPVFTGISKLLSLPYGLKVSRKCN